MENIFFIDDSLINNFLATNIIKKMLLNTLHYNEHLFYF